MRTPAAPRPCLRPLEPIRPDLLGARLLGDAAPTWIPLSRDPGRTRMSLLLGLNVLCTAMALALLVERHRPRALLVRVEVQPTRWRVRGGLLIT